MKKLICLPLALLFLTGCTPVYDGPTAEKSVPVEFLREHHSTVNDHVDTERTVYAYDIYGNLAQTIEYRNDHEIGKTVFTYDDRGNLLTETVYSLGGWFPRKDRTITYTYDEQDRILCETHDNAFPQKIEYIYDDDARTATRLEDGETVEVTAYDESGNILSVKSFSSDYWHLTEYTRDETGQVLTSHNATSLGQDITYRMEYDGHGNVTRLETIENGVRTERRCTYEYDEQGRLLREFEIIDGTPVETDRWEYLDENGSYIRWREDFRSYLRRFDDQGNQIELSHYVNETDQFGIREFTVYQTIRVPAEEVSP